jgi:hypothetical protein
MRGPVKISVEVPDELRRRAKTAAASSGVSLREYVIAALELATKASERARGNTALWQSTLRARRDDHASRNARP